MQRATHGGEWAAQLVADRRDELILEHLRAAFGVHIPSDARDAHQQPLRVAQQNVVPLDLPKDPVLQCDVRRVVRRNLVARYLGGKYRSATRVTGREAFKPVHADHLVACPAGQVEEVVVGEEHVSGRVQHHRAEPQIFEDAAKALLAFAQHLLGPYAIPQVAHHGREKIRGISGAHRRVRHDDHGDRNLFS